MKTGRPATSTSTLCHSLQLQNFALKSCWICLHRTNLPQGMLSIILPIIHSYITGSGAFLMCVLLVTFIKSQSLRTSSKFEDLGPLNPYIINHLVAATGNMCTRHTSYYSCGHYFSYPIVTCARKAADRHRNCRVTDQTTYFDFPCDQCQ